jgi:hypothetical protein
MLMLGLLAFCAWYANNSKRNQILCTFNRVNKTQIVKFVKMQNRFIVFDQHKFDIVPSRIQFRWYNGGFIHMLFPQWVATLTFSHTSRWPLDPNTNTYSPETPEVRNVLNKTEWTKSFFEGAKPQSAKGKTSLITQYLPWVAVILVLIVAVYFNSKMTGFGKTLDSVVNTINAMK